MRNVRSEFARLMIDVKLRRRLPARAHGARERDISSPLGRKNKAGRVGGERVREGEEFIAVAWPITQWEKLWAAHEWGVSTNESSNKSLCPHVGPEFQTTTTGLSANHGRARC